MNAQAVKLGFDQLHHVRWPFLEEVVAVFGGGEGNPESARKTAEDSVDLAETCVSSLHVGATRSMFAFEEPQDARVLVVRE